MGKFWKQKRAIISVSIIQFYLLQTYTHKRIYWREGKFLCVIWILNALETRRRLDCVLYNLLCFHYVLFPSYSPVINYFIHLLFYFVFFFCLKVIMFFILFNIKRWINSNSENFMSAYKKINPFYLWKLYSLVNIFMLMINTCL